MAALHVCRNGFKPLGSAPSVLCDRCLPQSYSTVVSRSRPEQERSVCPWLLSSVVLLSVSALPAAELLGRVSDVERALVWQSAMIGYCFSGALPGPFPGPSRAPEKH